jgi:tetratricopeptide (TPR) repeat protein
VDALTLQDPSALPLVGRESQQRLLIEALTSAKTRKRSAWLVRGPLGIGKSRLLDWLADEAEKEGFRVRRGSGLKGVTTPFGVFQQVFRGSPMAALASSGEPTMTVMLHYLTLLERDAVSAPLMILVDDLQSADADSARLLQFLTRNTKGLPVVLVAALETESDMPTADDSGPDLLEVLHSMEREDSVSTIRVEGMGREQIRQIAESFATSRFVSSPFLEELLDVLDRAGGNPYHILATIRSLSEGGQLSQRGDRLRLRGLQTNGVLNRQLSVPADAQAAVERRMHLLTEDERSLLQCAAVLGPEFMMEPVAVVLRKEIGGAVRLSGRLTSEHRFLRAPAKSNGIWAFTHPLTWHAVLESQKPSDRIQRARDLAEWYSKNHPSEIEQVAQLYILANDETQGQLWTTRALDRALERGIPDLVERYFGWLLKLSTGRPIKDRLTQGIEVVDRLIASKGVSSVALRILQSLRDIKDPPPGLRLEIESRLARTVCGIRGPVDARELLSKSSARVRGLKGKQSAGIRARWLLASGLVSLWEGRYGTATRELRKAEGVSGGTWLPHERCYLLFLLGSALLEENRPVEARRAYSQLVSETARVKEAHPRLELYTLSLAARFAERTGAALENVRLSEASHTLAWENDDVANATISLTNVAGASNELRAWGRALEAGIEAETLASRFRLTQIQAVVWLVRGETLVCLGSHEKGRELLRRALNYFEGVGSTTKILECRITLARSLIAEGSVKEGMDFLERASPLRGSFPRQLKPIFYLQMATAQRRLKNEPKARANLRTAWTLCSESDDVLGQAKVTAEEARLEAAFGNPADAEALWRKAELLFRRCGVPTPISRDDVVQQPARTFASGRAEPTTDMSWKDRKTDANPTHHFGPGSSRSPASGTSEKIDSGATVPLSLSQKVVAHIAQQTRVREDELASGSLTQAGMSAALNRPQGVVAKVLHRLESAGLTRSEARHVRGGSRRVKVYQLTPQGEALAKEVRRARAA